MADLSLEHQLLGQLGSENRTLRVNAIVQLAKTASSGEALKALQQLSDGSDRELSFFAAQAVIRIRSRLGDRAPEEAAGAGSPLPAPGGPEITRSRLLSPRPEEVEPLLARIRAAPESISGELQPPAAAFLGKYGCEDDVSFFINWLGDGQSGLIIPVIEAVEALAPHALTAHFPMLLASNHPIVRIRAISALRKIDEEEAEAHLSELLASRRSEDRIAGLSAAIAFPFPRIREYLLSILGEEQDPEVLHGCETLLACNPEIDTALRILDLIDTVPKPQAARLSAIFKSISASVAAAGLISGPEAPHDALLKLWRHERLRKFLTDLEIQIAVASPARREAIEGWLAKNILTPDVSAFVEKLALNPATEEVYLRLADFLPHAAVKKSSKNDPAPATLSEQNKLQILGHLDKSGWEKHSQWVREEARFGPPSLRAAAIRVLAKLSTDTEDLPLAESVLKQDEPGVQLAAFTLLEARSPDRLMPRLPALLASPDQKIRGRAVRFALKRDEKNAVEAVDRMLCSSDKTLRAQAVSCLILFPFNTISNMLLRALATEDHPAIARSMIVVLLTNPSRNILDRLDRIQAKSNPGVTMLIAQARMDLFDRLLQLGIDVRPSAKTPPSPAPAAQEKPVSRIEPEQPTRRETPKPYSVNQVRQTIRNREAGQRALSKQADSAAFHPGKLLERVPAGAVIAVGIIILGVLPILLLGSATPNPSETSLKTAPRSNRGQDERRAEEQVDRLAGIPTTFRMGRPCRLTGKILKVIDRKTFTFESDAKQFRCAAPAPLPMLLDGELVVVEMLPYRQLPNDQIAAEVMSLNATKP